jgi:hypothetical protein
MGIIPPDIYAAQIIDSDVVEIGKGNFQLGLKLEIIAGQFATRQFWDHLNIRNDDEPALQSAGQRALAELFKAIDMPPSRESADLHFQPFLVTVRDSEVLEYKPRAYRSRAVQFLDEGDLGDCYRDYLKLAA